MANSDRPQSEVIPWRWSRFASGEVRPYLLDAKGKKNFATWAPLPGSQTAFLSCPIPEVLYCGTRGGGKTDTLLMDFLQDVGQGWGADWKGILFRRTYPELEDVIGKADNWFPKIQPKATYNKAEHFWEFPEGEKLYFRHMDNDRDYLKYHGHAYTWIAWEELTNWATSNCYRSMFSVNRSSRKGIPLKVRATCNPYGRGHNWVKHRWRLPVQPGLVWGDLILDGRTADGDIEPPRIAIHSDIQENFILMQADPGYIDRIRTSALNKAQAKAWLEGCWDVVAGGMFDDIWEPQYHVPMDFPSVDRIPKQWKLTASYDHGQSKPFSVGFWAESNGEPITGKNGTKYGQIPGDLFRIGEWYGCTTQPNVGLRMRAGDIAKGILERQDDMGLTGRFLPGPADSSIFDKDPIDNLRSVADEFAANGVHWVPADKGPGSRKQGWQAIRQRLANVIPDNSGYREKPGLFILPQCSAFRRLFPVLGRSDKDPDDVDTGSEDHIGDECRYRVRWSPLVSQSGSWK